MRSRTVRIKWTNTSNVSILFEWICVAIIRSKLLTVDLEKRILLLDVTWLLLIDLDCRCYELIISELIIESQIHVSIHVFFLIDEISMLVKSRRLLLAEGVRLPLNRMSSALWRVMPPPHLMRVVMLRHARGHGCLGSINHQETG